MEIGERIADKATQLVGTKFRLHGRNPETGLDCVGLVLLSLQAAGLAASAPARYGLRNRSSEPFLEHFYSSGLEPSLGQPQPGDVIFALAGPAQFHLLIATSSQAFVHAHAGLRRVVALAGPLPWQVQKQWRSAKQDSKDSQ